MKAQDDRKPAWRIDGTVAFAGLLALHYGSVLLASSHNTALQLIALWGLALFVWRREARRFSRAELGLLLAVTALFAVAVISYAANTLWGVEAANLSRYARFLLFIPVYVAARRYATSQGFWFAVLTATLLVGLWTLLELAGLSLHPEDERWKGDVNGAVNPIQFGDLSLLLAALTCAGLPVYRDYGRSYLVAALAAIALAGLGCLGSGTRGAWIAIPVLAAINALHLFRTGLLDRRQLIGATGAGLLAVVLILQFTHVGFHARRALSELEDYHRGRTGTSVSVRFEAWQASWEILRTKPLVGVGPGMYESHVRALKHEAGRYSERALGYSHPHSEYAFVMATLGALGLLALAALWLVPLFRFARELRAPGVARQSLAVAGVILVAGYAQFGLTESMMFQHATFLGFYLLTVAVLVALLEQASQNGRREKPA